MAAALWKSDWIKESLFSLGMEMGWLLTNDDSRC